MIICGLKWVDMNRRMRIWIFFFNIFNSFRFTAELRGKNRDFP